MISRVTAIAIASLLLGACDAPTAPATFSASQASATTAASQSQGQQDNQHRNGPDESCTFSRGTTTCVSTVQYQETSTHSEYSGCRAGPNAVPGSRIRTFSDTYLVTVTTTTLRRGKSGKIYSSHTVTTRQLISSTLISDVCQPI
jgi:hypothetical protein